MPHIAKCILCGFNAWGLNQVQSHNTMIEHHQDYHRIPNPVMAFQHLHYLQTKAKEEEIMKKHV